MDGRVLITGVNGFIGRHLESFINNKDLFVHGCGKRIDRRNKARTELNLLDYSTIYNLLIKLRPNYIFHCAGKVYSASDIDYYYSNVLGTTNLLNAIREIDNYEPKILVLGSSAEYGLVKEELLPIREDTLEHPYNHYGISKLLQNRLCINYSLDFNLKIIYVRLFNVFGPGMSVNLSIGSFVEQINKANDGDIIKVGNLNSFRDYTDINDVVELLFDIMDSNVNSGIINVCSERLISMNYMLDKLIEFSNKDISIKVDFKKFKENDIQKHYGSNRKLMNLLGYNYQFKDIDKSLSELIIN